jgi:hypothetical protein
MPLRRLGRNIYYPNQGPEGWCLLCLARDESDTNPQPGCGKDPATKRKEDILEMPQSEIEMQKLQGVAEDKLEAVEIGPDIHQPPGPVLDTILRYRAANIREFKSLLDSLECIRSLRGSAT